MPQTSKRWRLAAPGFVVLYGSGFVGARLGLPHAEPFTFLVWRFALAGVVLALLAWRCGASWPAGWRSRMDTVIAGLLGIGCFSAGVFYSLWLGLPPASSAMIIALQPLLLAVIAPRLLGERVAALHWWGLGLGLLGVFLILQPALQPALRDQADHRLAVLCSVLALFGLCAGNLYQKARCQRIHPLSGGALQCAACTLVCAIGAGCFESGHVTWAASFIIAWLWMAVLVSVGAVSLLIVLIRDGAVSRVGGLFYLVPVSATLGAWLLFDQTPDWQQCLGMLVAASGVALTQRLPKNAGQA